MPTQAHVPISASSSTYKTVFPCKRRLLHTLPRQATTPCAVTVHPPVKLLSFREKDMHPLGIEPWLVGVNSCSVAIFTRGSISFYPCKLNNIHHTGSLAQGPQGASEFCTIPHTRNSPPRHTRTACVPSLEALPGVAPAQRAVIKSFCKLREGL